MTGRGGKGNRNCDQTNINHKIGPHAFNFLRPHSRCMSLPISLSLPYRLGLLYRAGGLLLLKLCTDGCFIVYVNSTPDTLWAYPFGISCIVLVSRLINCYIIKRITITFVVKSWRATRRMLDMAVFPFMLIELRVAGISLSTTKLLSSWFAFYANLHYVFFRFSWKILYFPPTTLCFPFARIFHQSAKLAYFYACRLTQIMHAKSTKTLRATLATPPAAVPPSRPHKPLTALTFTFGSGCHLRRIKVTPKKPFSCWLSTRLSLWFSLLFTFLFVFPTDLLCKLNKSTWFLASWCNRTQGVLPNMLLCYKMCI